MFCNREVTAALHPSKLYAPSRYRTGDLMYSSPCHKPLRYDEQNHKIIANKAQKFSLWYCNISGKITILSLNDGWLSGNLRCKNLTPFNLHVIIGAIATAIRSLCFSILSLRCFKYINHRLKPYPSEFLSYLDAKIVMKIVTLCVVYSNCPFTLCWVIKHNNNILCRIS